MSALCSNPDCGGFIDPAMEQGVPYFDRETKLVVILCPRCAEYFDDRVNQRYQRVETKGASE